MGANGRLSASELSAIPGGRLRHDAAAAWNDMRDFIGKKHGVWIAPGGPRSSYRTYDEQVYFWNLYLSGQGNLAARPGTSNHGWGTAVDVATPQMVAYIRAYGPRFGWKKTEAFGEWWHYNYAGGYAPRPKPDPLRPLLKHERKIARSYLYHRRGMRKEAASGKGPQYRKHLKWARYWKHELEEQRTQIARQAKKSGWKGNKRGTRYNIISKVLNGKIR